MTVVQLQQLLDQVRDGRVAPEEALDHVMTMLRASSYEDLGFARVDHDREWRQGSPEVVFGLGKTPSQIATIASRIVARGHTLLVTRATEEAFAGGWRTPWIFANARRLSRPVRYKHPSGAIIWVKLSAGVQRRISAQMR